MIEPSTAFVPSILSCLIGPRETVSEPGLRYPIVCVTLAILYGSSIRVPALKDGVLLSLILNDAVLLITTTIRED